MLQDKSFKSIEDELEEDVRVLHNAARALSDKAKHQNEEIKASLRSDVSTINKSYKNKSTMLQDTSFKSLEDKLEKSQRDAREIRKSARALLGKVNHLKEEIKASQRSDVSTIEKMNPLNEEMKVSIRLSQEQLEKDIREIDNSMRSIIQEIILKEDIGTLEQKVVNLVEGLKLYGPCVSEPTKETRTFKSIPLVAFLFALCLYYL
jgi:hypothetical protein